MIRGGFVELFVRDVGSAVRFYIETLGMKLVEEPTTGSASVVIIDAGEGFRVGLRQGEPASSGPRVVFTPKVPMAEAIAIFENRGVVFELTKEGATFRDPDGNALALRASGPG